jgi:hypothetical protein
MAVPARDDDDPIRALEVVRRPLKPEAQAIRDLQVRADVAHRLRRNESPESIARALGISVARVKAAYDVSVERQTAMDQYQLHRRLYPTEADIRDARPARVPPYLKRRWAMIAKGASMSSPPPPLPALPAPPTVSGNVLDNPDEVYYRREVLNLRKRALPYSMIAEHLGISEEEAVAYAKAEIRRLGQDELLDIDLARRMHIEQIDAMIAAIYDDATGTTKFGDSRPVKYEAIDRMVRLLDAKAKLLGLNAPQKIDIDTRLIVMADQMGADLDELREIAVEVLEQYSPGLRSGR